MGTLSPVFTRLGGKRGMRLEYRLNEEDRRPRIVNLVVEKEIKKSERFPFAYEFIDSEYGAPLIRVVAAPGVSVWLENFPPRFDGPTRTYPADMFPVIQFVRVQSPEVVPPLSFDVVIDDLLPAYATGNYIESAGSVARQSPNVVLVRTRSNGVSFVHPHSESELVVSVKERGEDRTDRKDASKRGLKALLHGTVWMSRIA